jgi:excisionase family DNA binding protein
MENNTNRLINHNKNVATEPKKSPTPSLEKYTISGAGKKMEMRFNDGMKPLSIAQATEYLGISRGTLYRLIDAKAIHSFHIGARHLITITALNDYIKNQEETENYGW